MDDETKLIEAILKSIVTSQGHASSLATAFHNLFSHGEIFEFGVTDEQLKKLFEHLDGIIKVIDDIEE